MGARVNGHKRASTYGLDARTDLHWSHDAACAQPGVDPDLWHTNTNPDWQQVGSAIHICRQHCPVQQECFLRLGGMRSTVIGGYYFNDQGVLSSYQPVAPGCEGCRDEVRQQLLDERFGPVALVEREGRKRRRRAA